MNRIINMISGPRNISTALMYSFAQRTDMLCMDEPFYAHYLVETGLDHPGRDEVLLSQSSEVSEVLNNVLTAARDSKVFLKNMGHHMRHLELSPFELFSNFFLIRHPANMIFSFSKVIEHPTIEDLGLKDQVRIHKAFSEVSPLPVIDSASILMDPQKGLALLCEQLEIPFDRRMLTWPSGPKEIDGCWSEYWYHNAHRSTGFILQEMKIPKVEARFSQLYEEAMEYYTYLKQFEIEN